jgi:hypothetical protein
MKPGRTNSAYRRDPGRLTQSETSIELEAIEINPRNYPAQPSPPLMWAATQIAGAMQAPQSYAVSGSKMPKTSQRSFHCSIRLVAIA